MIAVIDAGMGNIGSIINMVRKCGGTAEPVSTPEEVARADKIILPGVGAFDNGMRRLHERNLCEILNLKVLTQRVPILGICLGMQLFGKSSEEGVLPGLGVIPARTVRFHPSDGLRVPHMGWNVVTFVKPSPLTVGLERGARFYFVHSYHVVCDVEADALGVAAYGEPFVAAIQHDNVYATQFHPEKSHKFGLQLIRNFLEVV